FTNKERDDESGLYYHGLRYYSCSLSRWISSDPIGLLGGCNAYCYVKNMPMRSVDLTGAQDHEPITLGSQPSTPPGAQQAAPSTSGTSQPEPGASTFTKPPATKPPTAATTSKTNEVLADLRKTTEPFIKILQFIEMAASLPNAVFGALTTSSSIDFPDCGPE